MNAVTQIDSNYKNFISSLKKRVRKARVQAMLSVNLEQIKLYWDLGKSIISKQNEARWGSKILEQISSDLTAEFPDMKGLSRTNLYNMQQFAQSYNNFEIVQQAVGQLPWGHIVVLIQKLKDTKIRHWYARQALENGWARNALIRHIKLDLHARQANLADKTTNFEKRLPAQHSELLQELIKEPYDFGFLPLAQGAKEREIEHSLMQQVYKLIIELGSGFAFVGNQYHLDVGGDDFYIDLLFFSIPLNAYFIIELKTGKFKPEYTGQLNFYLSAVDKQIKQAHHNPSIGLLLCEEKNKVVAEYALNKIESPMGISEYRLSKNIPEKYKSTLPSPKLLQDKLQDGISAFV